MIYNVITHIEIQQVTDYTTSTGAIVARDKCIIIPFLADYEAHSTWEDLTQTLKVVLAKNAKYQIKGTDEYIYLGNTTASNSNLGGFDKPPVFMRGDLIALRAGYYTQLNGDNDTTQVNDIFSGYISTVSPKLPFTLMCEDAMWLCKQIPTPTKTWAAQSLQSIVKAILGANTSLEMLTRYAKYGVTLSVSEFNDEGIIFNVSNIQTLRGSLAMFLDRLKSQYKVDSYFRGSELRVGLTHYVPADNVDHEFTFQKNIISDGLEWRRRDDMQMSVIVKSFYNVAGGGSTVDSQTKTKAASTEILVYSHKTATTDGFDYVVKKKGEPFSENDIGERYLYNLYSPITDVKTLFGMGKEYLKKHYYDGFRGTFTTFGVPFVKHGDTVHIVDNILTERTGYYKVKSVTYRGGYDIGLRQDITIDYKIQ